MNLNRRLEIIQSESVGLVAVLYGGQSSEREISLQSGAAVARALKELGIEHVLIDVGPDIVTRLQQTKPDLVFIALHGRGGEDGSIQGVLEFLKLPYTGSGVLGSALALNKAQTKKIWAFEGLPTAPWAMLSSTTDWSAVLDRLGGRVMIKPVSEGSSIGMSQASSTSELQKAFALASEFDAQVIAEQWISGPEFTVSLLLDEALPIIQMHAADEFYTYQAKYLSEQTKYLCPADLSESKTQYMQDISRQAFDCLGCSGWGRIDLMQKENGEIILLEANTVPGLTSHSLVPMAAAAVGFSFAQMVLLILDSARSKS